MRIAATVSLALLLLQNVALADENPTAQPAGIMPTTMTLKKLLTLHEKAGGRLAIGTPHTRAATWSIEQGTLTGTLTSTFSGKDYREDTALGPFHSAEGRLDGKKWQQNRNGLTRTISGVHQRDTVNEYALAHALAPDSGVTLLGEVVSPIDAYVVKVDPKGGRIEYVFYDKSTYAVVRDESALEGQRVIYTYDDFRVTQGVREAWHTHRSNGFKDDDQDWKMQSLVWGAGIDPAKLAIPPSADTLSLNANRVTLPAKLSGDRVILTAQIGSHKVNLQLDSGASGILLNRAVADATGVKSYGQKTEVTAGQYLAADSLIPKIDFGGVATMQNVAAEVAPYNGDTYDGSPVAGLIGYDFIAGSVVHIDYVKGVVDAVARATFTPPAGAIALPIRLDDGVPIIDARIGKAMGHNFIVDTGADRSMIFSAFADAHPHDVADQGLGQTMTASFPFISNILGVGGKVEVRPVQVPSLGIGSIVLPDWLFQVSRDAPSFEGEDYDGLIGQDVLRNFDVYFDYSRCMMYLLPNDRYHQRWGETGRIPPLHTQWGRSHARARTR